ncbi:Uncharacterized protein Clim_1224 [hydrothermal vent metagenome]|uniref:Uncharacterized protein Clim_1224 n=1 Tax=hydrothermal vent metagenome TaxID=652676 RepID=A0A3B1AMG8_9ZZZZ
MNGRYKMLTVYESVPDGLLNCEPNELYKCLPGPSLIHLAGELTQPIFVSVLLHGNETTGWYAVRELLKEYQDKSLPRALSIFIANIAAAKESVRHLDTQSDYNRIWKMDQDRTENDMVHEVLRQMEQRDVFACIDIHNNSGRNPHYACINRLATSFFQLATLFANTVVYFIKPDTVLSLAFSNICPSVTIECGRPSESHGVEHALGYLRSVLDLQEFDEQSREVHDIRVFHTVAIVKLKDGVTIGLQGQNVSLQISPQLDQRNFSELKPDTVIALTNQDDFMPFEAINEFGKDVADRYFEVKQGSLRIIRTVMPSMLTLDTDIIRQDCFCYLMEPLDLSTSMST